MQSGQGSPMRARTHRILAYATRAVVALAVLGLGIAALVFLTSTRPQVAQSQHADARRAVEVVVVRPVPVRRTWEGYGTAAARDAADVAAEIPAIVLDVPPEIEAGRVVARGQILAVLDVHDFERDREVARETIARVEAQLAQLAIEEANWSDQLELAREEVAIAESEWRRARDVVEKGGGNPIEVDRRRRELVQAQRIARDIQDRFEQLPLRRAELEASIGAERARLAQAERDIARGTIVSPLEGVLQAVAIEPGERVAPGEFVARVVGLSRIEVPLSFPLAGRIAIAPGLPVELRAEGIDACWNAMIARVAPESDPSSRTFVAFAEYEQDPASEDLPWLSPGQFVRGVVRTGAGERLAVPRRALSGATVLVERGGVAEAVPVEIDFHFEGALPGIEAPDVEWAALAPNGDGPVSLRPGDRVIVSNVVELRPGMPVAVMDGAEPAVEASAAGDGRGTGESPG